MGFWFVKLVFFSAGVIVMVKGALMPYLYEIFLPNIVVFWNSFRCLLSSPLYICIIINSVVLLIAATSSFQQEDVEEEDEDIAAETSSRSDVLLLHETETETETHVVAEEEEESIGGERVETMESRWKAIVVGKSKKLSKSESWVAKGGDETWKKELRKLETFKEGVSVSKRRLRRDPTIGIDEFNQQVEAFINNFNQDMRLQRQQSDQRFLDMIKRGL